MSSASRPEAAPRVAAVLLTCRAEEEPLTADCIRSLRASDYPALSVVLVDNGSPPEVSRRLEAEFPEVTLLRTGRNLGFTGGNNRGIEAALAAGAEYLLVINNDTLVEPDCVSRLVEAALAHPRAGCVGGKILFHDDPQRIWFGGGYFSPLRALGMHVDEGSRDRADEPAEPRPVSFLTGCCMLIPAGVIREVGGFDEDFFIYVEDAELCLRIAAAGYELLYQPAARLYHRIPVEEPPIPPHKIVLRDRNRRRLARRHLGPLARLRFGAFFLATRAAHAGRYLATGDRQRARAIWQGMTQP